MRSQNAAFRRRTTRERRSKRREEIRAGLQETWSTLGPCIEEYEAQAKALLDEAEAVDRAEDEAFGEDRRGDEIPEELVRKETVWRRCAPPRRPLGKTRGTRPRPEPHRGRKKPVGAKATGVSPRPLGRLSGNDAGLHCSNDQHGGRSVRASGERVRNSR